MVMKSVIENQIQEVKQKISFLDQKVEIINKTYQDLESAFITPFLEQHNIVSEEYFLRYAYDTFTICALKDGIYREELVSFRIHNPSYSFGEEKERVISTSFYSTNTSGEFELNRMVIIGKVGQMLLDNKNVIIEGLNELDQKCSSEIKETNNEVYALEKELRELKLSLREIEKEEMYNILSEGVHFKMDDLVTLDINNKESRYLSYIKLLSTKNKSVVVKYIGHRDEDFTTATVRLMHLEKFIIRYSNLLAPKEVLA
jgi:ferritin-like metal-binding protein YciE